MQLFFESMSSYEKVLWGLTIPFTLIFVIQLFLNFLGIGGGDADGDFFEDSSGTDSGHGHPIFTFRNFIIFFTVFGWAGLTCHKFGLSIHSGLIISTVFALLILAAVMSSFIMMNRLSESGNFNIKNCEGLDAQVYLEIPPLRNGMGKIQLNVQGAFREIDAVTDENESIKTGYLVSVSDTVGSNIAVVRKKN